MSPPASTPWLRVGCDVVAVRDIENSLASFGGRFLNRIFTDSEIAYCAGRAPQLAARFAAKEAAIKAFATPDEPFVPTEIEIVSSGQAPTLALHGAVAALAHRQRWGEASVSLSHTDCHAMAVVVVTPDHCGESASDNN